VTEVSILIGHRFAEWARGKRIAPAQRGDGNAWTDGYCGLRCRQWTRVVGVGDACIPGLHFTLSACGPCIREFYEWAWDTHLVSPSTLRRAESGKRPSVEPRRSGRHRAASKLFRRPKTPAPAV